jgi:tetratricopeptide (TPR) repeat protein
LLLLLAGTFTLATMVQPQALNRAGRSQSDSILNVLLGDSRRMFANHFYIKADVSFHSGYYPSIFDQARQAEEQEDAVAHEGEHDEREHEEKGGFLGAPTDWIDRFGRHFRTIKHTHLEGGNIREILPWFRVSAELDPHHIETYTVAAYWLRSQLGKIDEAEQFLREGIRANPDSYEILYELGRLYQEDRHDAVRARNIWQLALRRWHEKEDTQKEPDIVAYDAITVHLANLEENEGNFGEAIRWLELAKVHSLNPDALQKHIDTLRLKLSSPSDHH